MKNGCPEHRWHYVAFAGITLLCFPAKAAAHLVATGMGPIYDGIGHLLLTPEDLVPALALALCAGLRGAISGRRAMLLLPFAWFAGGMMGTVVSGIPRLPVETISFILFGLLVAADLPLPTAAVGALAVGMGLVHGFFNGFVLKHNGGGLELLGVALMLFVLVALVSAFVVALEKTWGRIAVRVAGSWIFASGLLMLGWLVREAG